MYPANTAPQNNTLPKILCLHGSGTSASVFEIQTIRLRRELSTRFRFVFANGPFESPPGPGVLPVFEGMGPFYRWRRRLPPDDSASAGVSGGQEADMWDADDGVVDRLVDGILAADDDDAAPFVGVLGFSQGAGVAARTLLRLEERRRAVGNGDGVVGPSLRFGVFICGTPECVYSRDRPGPGHGSFCPSPSESSEEVDYVKVQTPTVQVHGLLDAWLPDSRNLMESFSEPGTATLIEFEGGHHLPVSREDTEHLAKVILWSSEES